MKRGMKRILSVLVVLVMLFSAVPASVFAGEADYSGKIIILHTNDVHGNIDGYQYIAGLKQDFESKNADKVILVDAGDYSQGTTYVSTSKGATAVALMNQAGYDIATLGNHEFDYGYAQLAENLSSAEFAVVCADVKDESGTLIFDPYKDVEANGVKIRFIGLETPEAQTKANPALIKGLQFDAEADMYAAAEFYADCDADIVIALAHLGVDGTSAPNRSVDLYKNTKGLDFIIDGHSHTVMTSGPDGEPIQSTGTACANVGVIVVDTDTKAIESNYLYALKDNDGAYLPGLKADNDVKDLADGIIAEIQKEYGEVFASTGVYLDGIKDNVRTKETNLGDLIADAMLWSVLTNSELHVDPENVVALTNGGGIRANLPAAATAGGTYPMDITKNDVNTVLPFGNTVAVVYVKGIELLEALEASTFKSPSSIGGFPQISGMNIWIDSDTAYDAGELYPGSTYSGPASLGRVTITDVNGKRFDPNATYAVVTNNFCAAGGDTYYAFASASDQFDTGMPLDEVLMDYIKTELGGEIGNEYAGTLGRINYGKPYEGQIVILHSNDVHGAVDGYQYIAGLKSEFEAKGAKVILVDAGDYSQGTTYVSTSRGASAIALMNEAGYDLATLGNHEFDYGYQQLVDNLTDPDDPAKFTVICADVKDKTSGATIFDAYKDIELGGVKIRFIGLETPEAQTKANPKLIAGLAFDAQDAMYADAAGAADCDADLVVLLSHLGVDGESEPNRSIDLYANADGIDFIIDGHSHTVMTEGSNGEPIQSTGTAFANAGVIVIDEESKEIVDNYLYPLKDVDGNYVDNLPVDKDVKALADEIMKAINDEYGKVFAKTEVFLDGVKNNVRSKETNLGDLIADSMIWSVLKNCEIHVDPENVVAITNGGGIRANLPANASADSVYPLDITKNDVNTVLPFGNTLAVIYVKGSALLEALEASTYCTPTTVGGFPQISGMNININTVAEYDANEETYPASTYYGPASINRVIIKDVNGKAFDPDETYAVVTNNFCAAGGDTYYAFAATEEQFDTGLPLDEVLMDYITTDLLGVIGDEYASPLGRIAFEELYDLTQATVEDVEEQEYTGSAIVPEFTITFKGNELEEGVDYTVAITDNTDPGEATVTITGQGKYFGTLSTSFKIYKVAYEITKGNGQLYVIDEAKLAFKCDGPLEKFEAVFIDGIEVPADFYKAASGSTVITFEEDYANSLKSGEHEIYIAYAGGLRSNTAKFTVKLPAPDTGDFTTIFLFGIMLASACGMFYVYYIYKRRYDC